MALLKKRQGLELVFFMIADNGDYVKSNRVVWG